MVSEERHEELKTLIAPYVLGAVPDDEVPEIRAHLLTCEECMAEADGYAAVAGSLALSVVPVDVPEGFEERILARAVESRPPARARAVVPWWRSRVGTALAAAAVVAVAVLGTVVVRLYGDLRLQREVTTALLRNDGLELHGAGVDAAMVPAETGAVFVAEGLGQAPEDRTYQLWLLDDGRAISAGTFRVDGGRALVEVDRGLEGVEGAAVTVEPAGGSEQPTTDPIISS